MSGGAIYLCVYELLFFSVALSHAHYGNQRQLLSGDILCREDGDGEDEQTAGNQQSTGNSSR